MPDERQSRPLSSDSPIATSDDDRFGRVRLARRIALEAVTATPDSGFVIALSGPWGSGKTSVINMVKEELGNDERACVVTFNPWLFRGAEDLVGHFFGQLATSLRQSGGKARAVANKVARYAGALSGVASLVPLFGEAGASILKAAGQIASTAGETPSLDQQRRELVEALKDFDRRIVVFVDDVDRLTDAEIREVVRLVKLVGDLPRLTYVLVFDRVRVEEALASIPGPYDGDDAARIGRDRGRAYLEKIVQNRHDVPPLRAPTLMRFMTAALDEALAPYLEDLHLHEHDWGNILGLGLRHMVHTPRDAKRLSNAAPAAVEMLGHEVALVDLLGLEALRVFEPDVHAGLVSVADILVEARLTLGDRDRQRREDEQRMDALLAPARHRDATKRILAQLFPNAHAVLGESRSVHDERKERRELRVSQPNVFRAYLHTVLDDDALAATEVARIAELIGEPAALRDAVEPLSGSVLADLVNRLVDYKDRFDPNTAVDVALIFLEAEPRLSPDESPFMTGRMPVSWQLRVLVTMLLLSHEDPQRRAAMAMELVNRAPSLTGALRALQWLGTFPDRDRRDPDAEMIDEENTQRLADDVRRRTAEADTTDLIDEFQMLRLLAGLLHGDEAAGRTAVASKAQDDALLLAMLRAAFGYTTSQTFGEAAVRRQPRLDWDSLSTLIGEDELRRRVQELEGSVDQSTIDSETAEALNLAAAIARGEVEPRRLPE